MIGMTTAEKKSAKTTSAKGSSVKKTGFQMLTRALGSMWRHEPAALVMAVFWAVCEALLPFGPVSYTPLAVYKRQMLIFNPE